MVAKILIRFIRGYQYFLSPLLGKNCRFYPSCSQYGIESIAVHGALKGSFMTIIRLVKCQPFHPGGYDPVCKTEKRCSGMKTEERAQ